MEITKRVKIVPGFRCNASCRFCYYLNRIKEPNRSKQSIKKDLRFAKNKGIEEIDFSGGEPTIHPDLVELIEYAKTLGFRRVCIITNAIRLADKNYYKLLKDAGLDETLFSIHGRDPITHDYLTNTGESFDKLIGALEIANELKLIIRTNTVVNKINYRQLPDISRLLLRFNPTQINFICLNDWRYARNLVDEFSCRYSKIALFIKEACDLLSEHLDNIKVRYIPFCFMQGYDRFVCNFRQLKYDPFEWRPFIRARLETNINPFIYWLMIIYGFTTAGLIKRLKGLSFTPTPVKVWRFTDILDDSIIEAIRHYNYKKTPLCKSCSYDEHCDGLEKSYVENFGFAELFYFAYKSKQ